jgi:DNA replication protein DnaC
MSYSGAGAVGTTREARELRECPFGLCDGSGMLYDEASNTAYDCRCRPQIIAARKARSLSAVIPRRYRDAAFERWPVTEIHPAAVQATRRFTRDIEKHLDAGEGLWFMGPIGTGKTTLAMLVSKAALEAGRSVAIYSLPRLLNDIREIHRSDQSHVGLLDRLAAVDLLHIDDVGAERTTDWVLEELYSIVNARYEDQRSMVITTNLYPPELSNQIGERLVSRLTEICGDGIEVPGDDMRSVHRPAGL